ncbi:Katanin p60 ATPase-containing subunit A-like 2 [Coelomomyces lativittatus]|nr:Katanin p60 ATPase-containing subunit A-like 2 [Coelomomyces lativittatus]KAJ1506882.1 Katanin p60 ATPase-containing subunit A-like 2 [Coelomomyces lativittatus]
MLSKFLPHNAKDTFGQPLVGSLDFSILASLTEGFSGADLRLIAKEALMIPLRRILKQLEEGSNLQHYNRDPVTMEDVRTAILSSKPTIDQRWTKKYADWEEQFGNS